MRLAKRPRPVMERVMRRPWGVGFGVVEDDVEAGGGGELGVFGDPLGLALSFFGVMDDDGGDVLFHAEGL